MKSPEDAGDDDHVRCDEVEPLLTPYIDGEATVGQRLIVSVHVTECETCRRRLTTASAGRDVLRARSGALVERAPEALRARCEALARDRSRVAEGPLVEADSGPAQPFGPAPAPSSRPWFRRRPMSLPAAAVLAAAMAGAAGTVYVVGQSTTGFAAQLTADHVKCFALFADTSRTRSAADVQARLASGYGLHVHVPPSSRADGLELVGGRRCVTTDGRMAHVFYVHEGHHLSLFVVADHERPPETRELAGYRTVMWSDRGVTYAVVSDETGGEVERAAAYIRRATQ